MKIAEFTFTGNYTQLVTGEPLSVAAQAQDEKHKDYVGEPGSLMRDFINSCLIVFGGGIPENPDAGADLLWVSNAVQQSRNHSSIDNFLFSRGADKFVSEVKRQLAAAKVSWADAIEEAQIEEISSLGSAIGGYTARGTWVPPKVSELPQDASPEDVAGHELLQFNLLSDPANSTQALRLLNGAALSKLISYARYEQLHRTVIKSRSASLSQKYEAILSVIERATGIAPKEKSVWSKKPAAQKVKAPQSTLAGFGTSAELEAAVKGVGERAIFTKLPQSDRFGLPPNSVLLVN